MTVTTPRTTGILCLLVTACGWALNWPSMKIILQVWPPLFARGLAGVLAAFILAAVAIICGQNLRVPYDAIPRLALAAFTNVFAWMGFSSLCMKWLDVGEGILLVYSMPIWANLLAWPILGTRPSVRGFGALLLGLAGIVVLFGAPGIAFDLDKAPGIVFALAAAVLFALGTVLNRNPLPLQPIASTAWQVGLGCLPMFVLGLATEHPRLDSLTTTATAALFYMTLIPMGICYLTWFAALRRLPPGLASTGMLLAPLLGVLAAAALLGEPLGLRQAEAVCLTLGGVALALLKAPPVSKT